MTRHTVTSLGTCHSSRCTLVPSVCPCNKTAAETGIKRPTIISWRKKRAAIEGPTRAGRSTPGWSEGSTVTKLPGSSVPSTLTYNCTKDFLATITTHPAARYIVNLNIEKYAAGDGGSTWNRNLEVNL